jgi:rhodanese-related sulfurtransferase
VSRIDELVDAARRRYQRITPVAALAAQRRGALLVDIRPIEQRRDFGEIPGAVVIPRNVLEWRLDPTSESSLAEARTRRPIVLCCQEGYSTSLAVAALLDIGIDDVTDVEGGFEAWHAAGLPVMPLDPAASTA